LGFHGNERFETRVQLVLNQFNRATSALSVDVN
jgi:hypothetical protein